MLNEQTIQSAIAFGMDTVRERLQMLPLSAGAIERVYGLDTETSQQLAADFGPPMMELSKVCVVFTFTRMTDRQAYYQVANLLAGVPGWIRMRAYTASGRVSIKSFPSMPEMLGVIHGKQLLESDQIVFRMLTRECEVGELPSWLLDPEATVLWVCHEKAVASIDQYEDRGGFDAWLDDHAHRLAAPLDSAVYPVIHVDCELSLTAERIHALAGVPQVSAIIDFYRQWYVR